MKRLVLLLGAMVCGVIAVQAQFDPQIGQYMFLPTAYNPAAAGDEDLMKVAGMHRMQFTGIKNAPMTTYFSFASPFVIGKTKHAAGVRFLNDRFGLFSNQALHAQYAYRLKLGNGYLAIGADLGFVNISFANDSVNLSKLNADYFSSSDPALPTGQGGNGMTFDLGLGIWYSAPTWWVSASMSHLTYPTLHWSDESDFHLKGTMYLAGGYNWRLRNKNWVLKPSMLVMSDFREWDINIAMIAELKDRYRFGASYRILGNVGLILGMDIIAGLQIGYTYELPTSKLIYESYGSHELYLAYGFDILKPKRTNRYKSVRYL
ncbi:MAG: PorP/SprF family type IX secretion system membrane protein [Paludibacteraceae bacterium]|nr:PorP/SprF family type IX secretion system membrane protein [Paludibacteraceae bacterium]